MPNNISTGAWELLFTCMLGAPPPLPPPQATADHFVAVKDNSARGFTFKRAADVDEGDVMLWVRPDSETTIEVVVAAKRVVYNTGLYAPLTLSGTIIVNGLAASVHRYARHCIGPSNAATRQYVMMPASQPSPG